MILRNDKGEVVGIVCQRGVKRCMYCGGPCEKLCDHPTGAGKKTCSVPMCKTHSWQPPGQPDTDYCRPHRRQYEAPARAEQMKSEIEAKKRTTLVFIAHSKYRGWCRDKDCGATWGEGDPCYWDSQTREVFCEECGAQMSPY
jgi:hypothetical protein